MYDVYNHHLVEESPAEGISPSSDEVPCLSTPFAPSSPEIRSISADPTESRSKWNKVLDTGFWSITLEKPVLVIDGKGIKWSTQNTKYSYKLEGDIAFKNYSTLARLREGKLRDRILLRKTEGGRN